MIKKLSLLLLTIFISIPLMAEKRSLPENPEVFDVKIHFNKDYIHGRYMILDSRTPPEKEEDSNNMKLKGNVILFLQGHMQQPDDGIEFSSLLSLNSKSGIVVVPVTDTPYGKDEKWRSDDAKDVILMEMTRYILHRHKFEIDAFKSITDKKVLFDPFYEKTLSHKMIPVKLTVVGWSHGGIIARRLASHYPDSVENMAQVNPAGYENWGGKSCVGPIKLGSGFMWESTRIGCGGIFRGETMHSLDAGCGFARGCVGDIFRSVPSCIWGNFHPYKPFRFYRNAQDCAQYQDDTNFPVPDLRNIVVVFGLNDSLFEVKDRGIKKPHEPTAQEKEAFWSKYYPGAVVKGANLTFKPLPGNHIAPYVHYRKYSETVLIGTGQKLGPSGSAEISPENKKN